MSVSNFAATLEKKAVLSPMARAGLHVLSYESLTQHALRVCKATKMFEKISHVRGMYYCSRLTYEILQVARTKRPNSTDEKFDTFFDLMRRKVENLGAKVVAEYAGKSHGGRKVDAALLSLRAPNISDIFGDMDHYPTDAELVVDGQSIKVHRHLLCMLSPVFNACFSHDTQEGKTGIIEITDFDFDVVQSVVDFCYGRKLTKPILHIVRMLRFADKYDIKCVTKKLGHFPSVHLKLDNFCIMARYAWDLEKDNLKEQCVQLYRRNVSELTLTSDFAELPINIREDILHCAIALRRIHADK